MSDFITDWVTYFDKHFVETTQLLGSKNPVG